MGVQEERLGVEAGRVRRCPVALALRPALGSLATVLSLTQGRHVWWSVLLAGTMCLSARMMEHGQQNQDVLSMSLARRSRFQGHVLEFQDTAH